ncbi:hypothetical protein FRC14_005205 [Serendipita sp. 396]|nr:hypothetical protein FRC14_005205 [Serendipita sp. 396]KAG8780403.1 hypothetical protein FRC15_009594 [Serendipita sp. 397]KAG8797209.1 hypothetical protein FRC16_009128 [Serendipita sp. 398]KAG8824073.1 hypothetical protein FRC19_002614 [Serendipita sp. 401]KAG8865099.1 hypothetical protein FRC20_009877 [Serendipita sp. 405]KAG9055587.1 hypothetical protein FS842_001780 [Serendipita sp. 407]
MVTSTTALLPSTTASRPVNQNGTSNSSKKERKEYDSDELEGREDDEDNHDHKGPSEAIPGKRDGWARVDQCLTILGDLPLGLIYCVIDGAVTLSPDDLSDQQEKCLLQRYA